MDIDKKELKNALDRAKYYYDKKGVRFYDDKHSPLNTAGKVTNILEHVNEMIEGYGIEQISYEHSSEAEVVFDYINMGDTYCLTVMYNYEKKTFSINSWGGVMERSLNLC